MWVLLAVAAAEPAAPVSEPAACDVPTAPIAERDVADAGACAAACGAEPACGAWTFVSGWGRCRLHAPTTRRVAVALVAAAVVVGPGGARALGPLERDHDHAGKDLEAAPRDLASATACGEACLGTPACRGFVYVEGYRACWLKREEGALTPKTFRCGARP